MHDVVVRGGLVVDGSGAEPFEADVAIEGGRIRHVGVVPDRGAEEIDARGAVVTPGFVDLHTHYDAQALWDPILAPSSWHGTTTVITGNCAVGFAPVRPAARSLLVSVMDAVEEIPEEVLDAGVEWDWESFPQYIDALERRRHTLDVGVQAPHVAIRAYVMGDRAERDEPATPEDVARMTDLAEEALRAGALGLSCSRTTAHRMPDGRIVPGTCAAADEVMALAEALARVPGRVMQYLGNAFDLDHDLPYTLELARRSRSPIHFILSDRGWRQRLGAIEEARREGLTLYGHVAPRAVGMILHWQAREQPFSRCPSIAAMEGQPWSAQLARLKDPAFRAQVLSEAKGLGAELWGRRPGPDSLYATGAYPDYEPDPKVDSIAAQAERAGVDPVEVLYDAMMADEGAGMIYMPIANYAAGDFSEVRQILEHDGTVLSLADGGAHCTRVCDSAAPTFMLTHWARDRTRGERLPLQTVVKALSHDTARSYGLHDRGRLEAGYLADLNVIDFDRLRLPGPYRAFDMPAGGQRLLQKAEGYVATLKRGEVTFRDGEHCGRYPGQVLRGPQSLN